MIRWYPIYMTQYYASNHGSIGIVRIFPTCDNFGCVHRTPTHLKIEHIKLKSTEGFHWKER